MNPRASSLRWLPVLAPAALTLPSCTFLGGNYVSVGSLQHEVPAGDLQALTLRTNVGDLRVLAWDEPRVQIVGELKVHEDLAGTVTAADRDRDLKVEWRDGALHVENAHLGDEDQEMWHLSLEVSAPAAGVLELETGVGSVFVESAADTLTVKTGVGDVEVRGSAGTASLTTGVGDLHAAGVIARATARSGTGSVHLESSELESAQMKTGVGSIHLRVSESGPLQNTTLETGTGDIEIDLPRAWDAQVRLETGVGDVSLANAEELQTERSITRKRAYGRFGSSKALVQAHTGVGSIRFQRGDAP